MRSARFVIVAGAIAATVMAGSSDTVGWAFGSPASGPQVTAASTSKAAEPRGRRWASRTMTTEPRGRRWVAAAHGRQTSRVAALRLAARHGRTSRERP
ncbi:MAG: hypothetical protein IVW53_05630 [Chloroflexi bacterium]|nr:hypothetical protein [Chloroflexota bacterium]